MGRRRRRIIESLEITDLVAEGKGLTRQEDKVIFVENAIPGDVVDVKIKKNKKSYAVGTVWQLVKPSPDRIEPFCKHFESCGGCKWQFLAYEKQLFFKEKIVKDNFERLGKLDTSTMLPIIGSVKTKNFRNKMEFTFSNNRWILPEEAENETEITEWNAVGFHVPKMFNKIVDITECHLQESPSNEIRNAVRDFALENKFTFYNLMKHGGLLRNLLIRSSVKGELMVILSCGEPQMENIEALLTHLDEKFPQIDSLHYVVNQKLNDTLYDQDIVTWKGKGYINEYLEELKFKISPKSFFQTNPYQALSLYNVVRTFADLKGDELVYDLYTGTGSIALFMARYCKKVIGVEEVADAIKDAKFNAEENNLSNSEFFVGDVKNEFNKTFVEKHGHPDLLITDPPRAGLHGDVVQNILEILPERIIYVSCNPATQTRDLALMMECYKIEKIQPVDMFPHTYHIENVVLLSKRNEL